MSFLDTLNDLDKSPTTTGSLIKAFCKNFNITQKKIAHLTGIQESNLSAICNDKPEAVLTVDNAKRIAAVIGVHPSAILFPNGEYTKDKEIIRIEKAARKLLKRA
ncbi:MAG: hypothetical protein CL674_00910 [Bdellovibrionaceae bacterium]|nr:hypothetical protein [Pseudobdellovibrionaceae bacterium]|tara:strand:+ start:1565 stop:1879 length:315 start_codon:yes stop_codon:yes gene_type:complete